MENFILTVSFIIRFILIILTIPVVGLGTLLAFIYKRFMDGVKIEGDMQQLFNLAIEKLKE